MVCVRTSERASEKDSKIISDGQDNRDNMNGSISGGGGDNNKKVKYK